MPDWSKVEVPLLSTANWGGQGLHPRGNFEGFVRAAGKDKWLEVHGARALDPLLHRLRRRPAEAVLRPLPQGRGHRLGPAAPGAAAGAPPRRALRRAARGRVAAGAHASGRSSTSTPRTARSATRRRSRRARSPIAGFGDGVTFLTAPLKQPRRRSPGRWRRSSGCLVRTEDADLFLVVRVFAPDLKEVVFQRRARSAHAGGTGWLRASHRKLDQKLTLPYRPYHTHDELQPMKPGTVYELDVEIWPTCIVVPAGHRIALTVRGKDYVYGGESDAGSKTLGRSMDRRRSVPPRRSARPPGRGVRRRRDLAHRSRPPGPPPASGDPGALNRSAAAAPGGGRRGRPSEEHQAALNEKDNRMTSAPQVPGVEVRGTVAGRLRGGPHRGRLALLARLHREFGAAAARAARRRAVRDAELAAGALPDFLPATAADSRRRLAGGAAPRPGLVDRAGRDHRPDRPQDARSTRSTRAPSVFMADFEDANTPTWRQPGRAASSTCATPSLRTIDFTSPEGRAYAPERADVATLVVRPRGWHLPERHVLVDGEPVSAAACSTSACTFPQARRIALDRGQRAVLLPAEAGEPPRGAAVERRLRRRPGGARHPARHASGPPCWSRRSSRRSRWTRSCTSCASTRPA